jgi:two-component system LytT family response regulator
VFWTGTTTKSGKLSASATHLVRASVGQLAERLDPAYFLRIQRSCLFNTRYILEFKSWAQGEYQFRITNGLPFTSTRSYKAAIQQF